jgi:hypothetical protein
MQNFADYKHRWSADQIDVVNVQVIRRLSLHNTRASLGDLRRWWLSRHATEEQPGALDEDAVPASAPAPVDDRHARELTAEALAQAGLGMRRLDRAAARLHLPFPIE